MQGLMIECMAILGAGVSARAWLMPERGAAGNPSWCVSVFHRVLAEGRLDEAGNFFSFPSAYQYWQDVTAGLGASCPCEDDFRRMVMEAFGSVAVRAEVSSYTPTGFREKVIGCAGSVVFAKRAEGGASTVGDTGVASVVREGGRWKVRTYPGVFPGELLALAGGRGVGKGGSGSI